MEKLYNIRNIDKMYLFDVRISSNPFYEEKNVIYKQTRINSRKRKIKRKNKRIRIIITKKK